MYHIDDKISVKKSCHFLIHITSAKIFTILMSKYFVSHLLFHIHERLQTLQKLFFSAQILFVANFIPQKTPV